VQPDATEKLLDQRDATKLGEAHSIGGNTQISWSASHCAQTSLLVLFQRKDQNNRFAPSEQSL
jgi:hypothetical protein